jgi:acyl-CoA reductase-like NAD-dependent aldehyde dehydrogenase
VRQAIGAATEAAHACRKMPSFARAEVLRHVERRMNERFDELAYALAVEAGKPIRDARGEVSRAIDTFRVGAEEATRIYGEHMPLDISPRAQGCEAVWKRVPLGPCGFITPFNFPLNLVAHKIAPAIAAGCPFVLKPATYTPVSALLVGEILEESSWPKAGFSILPCKSGDVEPLVVDPRIKLLSFTGSAEVGWNLKAKAGKKRVALELGGNAGCIVDRDVDQDHAVQRLTIGSFSQAGQSCISVQRVFIHESIYESLKGKLVQAAAELPAGDPFDPKTFVAPLITLADAERVESWVGTAAARGARVLCGGTRHGAVYQPTFIENVPDDCDISCKEVFGPVALLEPFRSFDDACRRVNASDFGLQAGVFTQDLHAAFYAFNELEVGGVVINDVPSFRVDSMPYGGVKDSGLGREGLRFSIEEMTEMRLMVLNNVGRTLSG